MQFSSNQSPEERLAAMRKKAKTALKQRENEHHLQRTKTAQLKALRLERDAEGGVSDKVDE